MTAKKPTVKNKTPLEKELNKQIVQWLDLLPSVIWFDRMNSGTVQTTWGTWVKLCRKGTPDYIALVSGGEYAHVIFIESKRKGGVQRLEQKWFEESVQGISNVHYIMVEEVLPLIDKINEISLLTNDKKIPS